MKLLAILVFLTIAGQYVYADYESHSQGYKLHNHVQRLFGGKIKAALEKLQKIMKTGDESVGIPKLDSFDLIHQEIHVNEELIVIDGNVTDIHVEGLSDFIVQNADYELFASKLVLDLLWPNITGIVSYNLNATVLNQYPFYGAGDVSFELNNFNYATKVKVQVNLSQKKVTVISFENTKISLEKLQTEITGLFYDDEFSQQISPVISDMAPEILEDLQEEITDQVNIMLVPLSNQLLEQIDIWKFIT